MALNNNRVLWKGAIAFGLVHVPIALHSATREQGIDFDWLDQRTLDPVGYKRVNKRTGKEIDKAHIAKGIEVEDGQYVIVSPEEIASAFPDATQTIEIERFVDATEIPFVYLERPYYVTPIHKGLKVYVLLRDALLQSGKIGLAKVVIHTKQHLAALVPSGKLLVLNLLRWGDEIKSQDDIDLADLPKQTGISATEMKMATQLIEEMTGAFDPDTFKDEFREGVMALVKRKVGQGDVETVHKQAVSAHASDSSNVVDLTALLKRSLKGDHARTQTQPPRTPSKKPSTAKTAKPSHRATTKTPSTRKSA